MSPITHIFNTSISTRTFPDAWKTSKIVPVAKVKDPGELKDYRPISILAALSKALELIMRDQIVSFCNERGLIDVFQSGFRPGHSTTTALLKITDDILVELERKFLTILVLLDFSKAFDTVSHDLLCRKLLSFFSFSDSAVQFVRSYLTGRTQCVFSNDAFSFFTDVTQGVPQGSVLGPLLFSLFINDIVNSVTFSRYHIYADDVQIYLSGRLAEVDVVIDRINEDLASIFEWSERNGLRLNSQKSQAMAIFRRLPSDLVLPPIKVGDATIPYSSKLKNLGIIMNSSLTWDDQISSVLQKVYFTLSRLWCSSSFTPTETRRRLVVALIVPIFLYCDVIYSQSSLGNRRRLNLAYNACARYVYGVPRFERISAHAKNVMGVTLDEYHTFRMCSFIFTLVTEGRPAYLVDKLQIARSSRTLNLIPPRHQLSNRGSSLFVKGATLWNSLPPEIKLARSTGAFRKLYFTRTPTQL
jgi:Reverse transcriptase (RNA-dependent DNA polymerase)